MNELSIRAGLLNNARYCASPNFDDRPTFQEINLLVIHNISLPPGEFGTPFVEKFFTNCLPADSHPYFREISHLKVSCHLFINRLGEVVQFVPFTKRAWHAGVSCFKGVENCNNSSIGIELEGQDELPYTPLQYQLLASITAVLMEYYPAITLERIVGHCDVAPDRKTDPGPAFDWQHYKELIGKLITNQGRV